MLPEWSWAWGTLSEYRLTMSLRGDALCSGRDYARILSREGLFANTRPVSHRRSPEDDNSAIIKMKRATPSPRQTALWSGVEPVLSGGIARGTKTHARRIIRNFLFTSGTDVDVYFRHDSFLSSLHTTFPKYGSLFRQVALYLARASRFTANCKCKFDSGFLSREWK